MEFNKAAGCIGKQFFTSLRDAQIFATGITKRTKSRNYAYQCPNCRNFHISHEDGKPMNGRKARSQKHWRESRR